MRFTTTYSGVAALLSLPLQALGGPSSSSFAIPETSDIQSRDLPLQGRPRIPIPLGVSAKPVPYFGPSGSVGVEELGPQTYTAEELSRGQLSPTYDGTIILFARGTGQYGNIGQNPGPQFLDSLKKVFGPDRVVFQGVTYTARVMEFFEGGSKSGTQNFATAVEQAALAYPNAKLVLSGFR
jgi:hypothetical protein